MYNRQRKKSIEFIWIQISHCHLTLEESTIVNDKGVKMVKIWKNTRKIVFSRFYENILYNKNAK